MVYDSKLLAPELNRWISRKGIEPNRLRNDREGGFRLFKKRVQ